MTKTPLSSGALSKKPGPPAEEKEECYDTVKDKRHTLFNGTRIIQTRYYGKARVLAVVVCTGEMKTSFFLRV